MTTIEKPKEIPITLGDRKDNKYKSFVVYDSNIEEVEKKIKRVLSK